jgi:hypothetical protein
MTRTLIGLVLTAMLAPAAFAHEGHEHKVMGTVSVIHQNHLEVKATADGKLTTVTLSDKTKIVRDKSTIPRESIKAGDRVVVTYVVEKDATGKDIQAAREVRLGTAGTRSGS